jgi:hypothetical protein
MQSIWLEKDATTEEVKQVVWVCDGSKVSDQMDLLSLSIKKHGTI